MREGRRRRSRKGPGQPDWFLSTFVFGESGDALLRARGGARLRILGDQLFERLLRAFAITHGFLRARDGEHRVGRLVAVRVSDEQLSLSGDRLLVIALAR